MPPVEQQRAQDVAPGAPTRAPNFAWTAWLAYIVLAVGQHWHWGLLGGFIGMAIIVAQEYRHHAVKIVDCTSLGFFAVMLAVSIAIGTWLIAGYSVLIVWAAFAIVFWTTIAIGFPFTLQYAREQAPPAVWRQPIFIGTNYRISLLWAIVATINAALGIAMQFSSRPLIVGLLIPATLMIFAFVAGGWYGKHIAAQYKEPIARAAAAHGEAHGE